MRRTVESFFYGLFMSVEVLRQSGARPVDPRRSYVDGYRLAIGERATLIPCHGGRCYGMLIGLTYAELDRLYGSPGLTDYRPAPVLAQTVGGTAVPALCYILPAPPRERANAGYAARLQELARELGFPAEYVESLVVVS